MQNSLRDYELEHIARLLETASDQFSNHSCNDYRLEPTEMNKQFASDLWLKDGEERADIQRRLDGDRIFLQDFTAMRFLANRCREAMEDQARAAQQAGPDLN